MKLAPVNFVLLTAHLIQILFPKSQVRFKRVIVLHEKRPISDGVLGPFTKNMGQLRGTRMMPTAIFQVQREKFGDDEKIIVG